MSILKSEIDTRSENFQRNQAAMQAQVDDLKTDPTGNAGGRVACGVIK